VYTFSCDAYFAITVHLFIQCALTVYTVFLQRAGCVKKKIIFLAPTVINMLKTFFLGGGDFFSYYAKDTLLTKRIKKKRRNETVPFVNFYTIYILRFNGTKQKDVLKP
jgi:hypothetical protein